MKILVEEKLIDILREQRKHLNITQGDLAGRLGLSTMGLSYLERGSRQLKLELLNIWAHELGLEVEISIKELEK